VTLGIVRSVLSVTIEPCETLGTARAVLSVVVVTPDIVMMVLIGITEFDAGEMVPGVGVR